MTKKLIAPAVLLILPAMAMAQAPATQPGQPGTAQQAAADQGGPRIEVAEKIKDYGVVSKGEKISAVFEVKNTGDKTLQITQVRPTCGCTVADFDKTIEPGQTGKVHAEVDTAAFLGPISKAVLVFSDDPTTPQVSLVIKADVRAFIEVKPRPIIRFNALQGEPTTDKVTLVASDGTPFRILGAETAGGPYKVTYAKLEPKEGENGITWEVTVTVPADAPEGLLNHKIAIETSSEKAAKVPITITGVVRPILQVIPPEINFGTVPGDAPVGRNIILVNNRQGAQLELTSAEVDNSDFSVEVIPLEAGQRFQLAVSLPVGASKGEHKGTLTIKTNDPSRSTIKVPVTAKVQ